MPEPALGAGRERGRRLIEIARDSLAEALLGAAPGRPPPAELESFGACFVTLFLGGELRGCIGSLEACRPLADDVRRNALGAALHDPRFPPLRAEELLEVEIEVSELTPLESFEVASEVDARARLRPGIDGVVLEYGELRATFLPQVWEQLPRPSEFLARLKQKAGLEADFWAPELRLKRYRVRKWRLDGAQ